MVVNSYKSVISVRDHLNQGVREESCVAECGERFAPLTNFFLERSLTNHELIHPPEDNGIHIVDHSEHLWCSINLFLFPQYENRPFYTKEKSNKRAQRA